MKNLDLLKQVLTSTAEYWIVAKMCESREYMKMKRDTDQILLILIPTDIRRGLKYEEITLSDLEKLNNSYVNQNIFINTDYPPFQQWISFSSLYSGCPVECDVKQFMIDAIALKSDELYDYKSLIKVKEQINQ